MPQSNAARRLKSLTETGQRNPFACPRCIARFAQGDFNLAGRVGCVHVDPGTVNDLLWTQFSASTEEGVTKQAYRCLYCLSLNQDCFAVCILLPLLNAIRAVLSVSVTQPPDDMMPALAAVHAQALEYEALLLGEESKAATTAESTEKVLDRQAVAEKYDAILADLHE